MLVVTIKRLFGSGLNCFIFHNNLNHTEIQLCTRIQLFQINIGTVNRQESLSPILPRGSELINLDDVSACKVLNIELHLRVIANCCQIRALCTFSQVSMKCVLPLASGAEIPVVGLGTWQATAQEVEDAVTTALDSGYRHIDTAFNYNNEEAIGNALTQWFSTGKGKREDVFITSKLPHIGNRTQDVSRFLQMSLERLKLNYVDLYLIHMPFGFICDESTLTPAVQSNGEYEMDLLTDHLSTWKAMEEQVKAGLVKHIGLSNFNSHQIRKVYDNATIKPSVLQVELHAYMQQKQLRALCKELNIIVTAYSPLGSPAAKSHFQNKYNFTLNEFPNILGHPVVLELVNKYNKSPAQILLKHLVQHNIVVIPKSANATRIADNLNIFDFELTKEDIRKLDTIDCGEQGRIFNFLFFKGIDKHPEYPFAKLNDSC